MHKAQKEGNDACTIIPAQKKLQRRPISMHKAQEEGNDAVTHCTKQTSMVPNIHA